MANDYDLTQPPLSPLEASDADRLEMSQEATQAGADASGPLSDDMVGKADTQIGDLRHSSDTEYNTALAQQQQIANGARDALRAARERLSNEKPDRSAMWLAVAGALGQPTNPGGGTMAGIANAAATASPFMGQEAQDKRVRDSNVDRLGLTLSEYGTGKDAFDPDLINTHLAQSKLKQMLANQMEVAMLRRGKGSTANPLTGATELAKLNAEMDGLDPSDPNYATKKKQYQDKIRLLTTREPNATAITMEGLGRPDNQELLWQLTKLGAPMPQGYRSGPMLVSMLDAAIKRNPGKSMEEIARLYASGQQNWKAEIAEITQAARTAGNVSFAVNELEQTIPLARASSMKVPRGTFVPLGQLFQWGARLNSNPALKDFAIKNQAVLNAYDMFAKRGGTDVGKRETLHNNLVTAESAQAYNVALKAIEQEMHAAKRAGDNSMRSPHDERPPEAATPEELGNTPSTKTVNGQVWALHKDGRNRKAYVSPDGKQFQLVVQ